MISGNELLQVKRRLSPRLLGIDGVTGIGLPSGKLTVYLADDTDAVRRNVQSILESEAPGVPFSYVHTGAFRAH